MATVVNQNRDILQHFFDALNSGDVERVKAVFKEYYSPNYRLHFPNSRKPETTFEEFFGFIDHEIGKMVNVKWETQDFLQDGDKTATRGTFEWTNPETNEFHKEMTIFITRFEDGKIVEEWQLSALI